MEKKYDYIFFGTPRFAMTVLEEMEARGFLPSLIVTTPDTRKGRRMVLTPPEVKIWAKGHSIALLQSPTLKTEEIQKELAQKSWDFFVVASYGLIIPKEVLDIPKHGVLNIHPSLLPKLRGASPIQSAILNEKETGVSIMLMDEKVDHGPVLIQKKLGTEKFPIRFRPLERCLAQTGAELLCDLIPDYVQGKISGTPQDEDLVTSTRKVEKSDAELRMPLDEYAEENYRKILAFEEWPKAFFFIEKSERKLRIVVKEATLTDGKLKLLTVTPEGRGDMTGPEFQKWIESN